MNKLVQQISYLIGLVSVLFIFILLLVLFFNPAITTKRSQPLPALRVYLDHSISMYPYQERVKSILDEVGKAWKGPKQIVAFADRVADQNITFDKLDELSYLSSPTFISGILESLKFSNPEEPNLLISDFIWADGEKLPIQENLLALNLSTLNQQGGNKKDVEQKEKDNFSGAAFILNQDHFLSGKKPVGIKILFYHQQPDAEIEYRISLVSASGKKDSLVKKNKLQAHFLEVEHQLEVPPTPWVQIKVGFKLLGNQEGKPKFSIKSDSMNFISDQKKVRLSFVYFKPSKDGQALKNSLERYKFFNVDFNTVFHSSTAKRERLLNELSKDYYSRIYFLVAPSLKTLKFFKDKKLPVVHVPDFHSERSKLTKLNSKQLSLNETFINFLGDQDRSRDRWEKVARNMQVLSEPTEQILKDGWTTDKSEIELFYQESEGSGVGSGFYRSGNYMYLGIKGIRLLNERSTIAPEDSYLDLFLVRLVQNYWDIINQNNLQQQNLNFFLGEDVTAKQAGLKLPHLITKKEEINGQERVKRYVEPLISRSGSFQLKGGASQGVIPPVNYRIPFREYVSLQPVERKSDPKDSNNSLDQLLNNITDFSQVVQVKEVEMEIRNDLRFFYLLLVLFLLFIFSKWVYFRVS